MSRGAGLAQIALGLSLPGPASFADYWPGRNAEPLHHVRQFAIGTGYQLLYLWGATGTGKTHLLHAACNAAAGRRVGYLPLAEVAAYGPVILENADALDLLCVDDLQLVAGNDDWEHALFDCCNRFRESERRLVLGGMAAPAALAISRDDLSSRIRAGLVCHLQPVEDSRLADALAFLCARRGMDITAPVIEYLLRRIPRDIASLAQWVERLDIATLQAQRRLTVPFVRELMAD